MESLRKRIEENALSDRLRVLQKHLCIDLELKICDEAEADFKPPEFVLTNTSNF